MLFKHVSDPRPAMLDYWRDPVIDANVYADDRPLQPSERDFRLLAENLPVLCWIAAGDGYICWYNRRWHDYCGTTPDAMLGWGWQSVHDQDQLPLVLEGWSSAIATGEPFEMTFPLRGADGLFRRFLTRVVPLRDGTGKVVRWFGTNTDVESQMRTEAALEVSEAKLGVLTDAMPQMVWSTLPDGYHDYYNAQWYAFTGVPAGSTDGEGWNGMFHPDDQERAWTLWRQSLETGEPYEIEYRLRHHSGEYRWTLGRALAVRDTQGKIVRWIGTCTDIDDAKRSAEHTELMSQELSHRIKNIFAVIAGLIGLSSGSRPEVKEFATDLSARIASLGRAHDFARPHSIHSRPDGDLTGLHGLLSEIMRPYRSNAGPRFDVSGDDVTIDDAAATPIALVIHELATNAAKYGALSADGGTIEIFTAMTGEDVEIRWLETGGPEISEPPGHAGFGTRLSQASIEGQLGGTIVRHWHAKGLEVVLTVAARRLCRVVATN
jgi:PAS domain S-box-containing protein